MTVVLLIPFEPRYEASNIMHVHACKCVVNHDIVWFMLIA